MKGENHPQAKLTDLQVLKIRELFTQGFSKNVIAKNFKVSTWNITEICNRRTWNHI